MDLKFNHEIHHKMEYKSIDTLDSATEELKKLKNKDNYILERGVQKREKQVGQFMVIFALCYLGFILARFSKKRMK